LRGSGWWDANGCCDPSAPHLRALLPANGTYVTIETFAIDWIRVVNGVWFDAAGMKLSDYPGFGAQVHAVADGTVISIANKRPEAPLQSSSGNVPSVTNPVEFAGNHVIEKIGRGKYAVYAHLQPGSVGVRPGQHVRSGQVLGLLGNSGNSSDPHLHFSIQDGPDPLTSTSLPFVIDRYRFQGTAPPGALLRTVVVTGMPREERRSYPLEGALTDFSR
jgi:murein DD-endopeptidase MepM/ murein hydrolase activator NlpD